jgi:hypothetical protein
LWFYYTIIVLKEVFPKIKHGRGRSLHTEKLAYSVQLTVKNPADNPCYGDSSITAPIL